MRCCSWVFRLKKLRIFSFYFMGWVQTVQRIFCALILCVLYAIPLSHYFRYSLCVCVCALSSYIAIVHVYFIFMHKCVRSLYMDSNDAGGTKSCSHLRCPNRRYSRLNCNLIVELCLCVSVFECVWACFSWLTNLLRFFCCWLFFLGRENITSGMYSFVWYAPCTTHKRIWNT